MTSLYMALDVAVSWVKFRGTRVEYPRDRHDWDMKQREMVVGLPVFQMVIASCEPSLEGLSGTEAPVPVAF